MPWEAPGLSISHGIRPACTPLLFFFFLPLDHPTTKAHVTSLFATQRFLMHLNTKYLQQQQMGTPIVKNHFILLKPIPINHL